MCSEQLQVGAVIGVVIVGGGVGKTRYSYAMLAAGVGVTTSS